MVIGGFLLRRLQEAGIGHILGVPGDFNLELQQMEDGGLPEMGRHVPRDERVVRG